MLFFISILIISIQVANSFTCHFKSVRETTLYALIPNKKATAVTTASTIVDTSQVSQVEDDGYNQSRRYNSVFHMLHDKLRPKQPGTLILVRHGESSWNYNKTFTGWCDVDLSELGEREVEHAARLLLERVGSR
jgi:hypothetical protein